jgi:hypothetical protein
MVRAGKGSVGIIGLEVLLTDENDKPMIKT